MIVVDASAIVAIFSTKSKILEDGHRERGMSGRGFSSTRI
jgi:predicted nucleic acid-binding protein